MTENRGSRRTRGRQPENTRASGFYSRLFKEGEIMDFEARQVDGLMDEIALLRIWTRRVVAFGEGVESLDEAIDVLGALGSASLHLSHLLRSQKALGGTTDEFEQNFLKALDEVQREFKIRR